MFSLIRVLTTQSLLFNDMTPLENRSPNHSASNADQEKLLKERIAFLETQVKTLQTIIKAQNSKLADQEKRIQVIEEFLGTLKLEASMAVSDIHTFQFNRSLVGALAIVTGTYTYETTCNRKTDIVQNIPSKNLSEDQSSKNARTPSVDSMLFDNSDA